MLAVSGGRLIGLSTPFGTRGWFWFYCDKGGADWLRVQTTAEECPRITAEFLAEEREHLGEWWFAQEYECRFMAAQTAAFTWAMVENAMAEEVESWQL